MRILLVNPATVGYSRSVTTPLGLLSIASCLQAEGYTVRIYDRTVEKVKTEDVFREFSPDVVGVSLVSFKSVGDAIAVSEYAKKFSLPVVWGGPLASEVYDAVLKNNCVDLVSIGEGEATWLEISEVFKNKGTDFSEVAGLAFRNGNGEAVLTKTREFVDLAELPPIDWTLIDLPKYFQTSYECSRMLYLYSAKGCPHNCAFCYNKDFHRCTYRKRPIEHILDEIRFLVSEYGMDGVYFADEMWGKNREEMRMICDSLRSLNLNFVWGCQTRIGVFNEADFRYMYDSGCRWIFFGVESGSKRILSEMNKRIPFDKIEETFRNCRDAGIIPIGSFIVGFPGETTEDLAQTVSLIEKLPTSLVNLNFFALVPGSDIYNKLVEEGRYPKISCLREMEGIRPIERNEYSFTDIPETDLKVIRSWYMWRSFSSKSVSENTKSHSFTKKVIIDALKQLRRSKLKDFAMSMILSAMELISVFYYAHFYPSVKKKYGINRK